MFSFLYIARSKNSLIMPKIPIISLWIHHHWQSCLSRTFSAYTVDAHILTCTFYEILSQMTVEWTLQTSVSNIGFLDISQGTITNKAQTSTLTLTSEQLVKLKAAGASDPAHIFTCKITVAPSSTVVEDALTSNIYTPSELLRDFDKVWS